MAVLTHLLTCTAHPALLTVQTQGWIQGGVAHPSVVTVRRPWAVCDVASISTPPRKAGTHMGGSVTQTMTRTVHPNPGAPWDVTDWSPPPNITITPATNDGAMFGAFRVTVDTRPALVTVTDLGLSRGDNSIHTRFFTSSSKVHRITLADRWVHSIITHSVIVTVWLSRTVCILTSIVIPARATGTGVGGAITASSTGTIQIEQARTAWDVTQPALPSLTVVANTRSSHNHSITRAF